MKKIQKIVLLTGNAGKMEEFKAILGLEELQFGYKSMDLPEIQSLDIGEIGRLKTQYALMNKKELMLYDAVLTDDTALCCDALNGLPGTLIKWFLKSLGKEGIIDLLRNKTNSGFVTCLLSLGLLETGEIFQFEGSINGRFVFPKGEYGFGWDPIFLPEGHSKTYGEMGAIEKNKISHRTSALRALREWLLI